MHKRKLGHTDLELSEIALGTWGLSGAYGFMDDTVSRSTIQTALEAGITTFDASPLWGDGKVETLLGEELEKKRDEVQLITRGGATWDEDSVVHRFDEKSLREDLEASLERLKTKKIDVWLLHDPPSDALKPPESEGVNGTDPEEAEKTDPEEAEKKAEAFRACEAFKDEGLIAHWGITTTHAENVKTALEYGAQAICMPYNLLHSDDLHDLEAQISAAGAGVLARSPLFHGLLAGRWTEYRQFGDTDHRKARWTRNALMVRVRQVNQLRYLVHDDVTSLATAAVRYVLASHTVSTCILGARRPMQIRTAKAMAGEPPYLPEDDMLRLGQILSVVGA